MLEASEVLFPVRARTSRSVKTGYINGWGDKLIGHWRSQNLKIAPGNPEARVREFESHKRVRALLGARRPLLFWEEAAGVLYEQT